MRVLLQGGAVWRTDRSVVRDCPILWEAGRILAVGGACEGARADRVLDARGLTVLPGLVDVHTHGRAGYDFVNASEEELCVMKREYLRRGVTSVFATLASGTVREWEEAIGRIERVGFAGIHLEGRYLHPQKRGAHAPELLVKPDAAELERILGQIRLPVHVTAAFELDEDGSFAETARRHGATMGIGHTNATAAQTREAIARGVTAFTHLFNTMPPLHHREGGPVSVALGGGRYAELIADGIHISPEVIALAYRCIGAEHTVLITDSMSATDQPDGSYLLAGQPVTVRNGRALTEDGALAGSTLNLWDGVKNLMRFASIPLEDAIACATVNPARMVGIDADVGSIEPGRRADFLLVDGFCHRRGVIAGGEPQEDALLCLKEITGSEGRT